MSRFKEYIESDRGQAFKASFWLCWVATGCLTFFVGAISQAGTLFMANVPTLGHVWGISNRMLPVGLFLCLLVLAIERGCDVWSRRSCSKDIISGGFLFSLCGFVLALGGF